MLLIDGKIHESQELPIILFGPNKPLAYVLNPKAACTLALHFVFFVNHDYRYFDEGLIHTSPTAFLRLKGPELDARVLNAFYRLAPETFSIVRDPLQRFISGFLSKVLSNDDHAYVPFRDMLTSLHGIDLSPEADAARSCLAFAKWIVSHDNQKLLDPHFRPQHFNLAVGSRFRVSTILRLEDRAAVLSYFSRWIGAEKAKWFLSFRFNEHKKYKGYKGSAIVTDELKVLARRIYAKDYELFYDASAASDSDWNNSALDRRAG